MKTERLDKIISSQLNISRSQARTAVRKGQVSVNNQTVKNPSLSFFPDTDKFAFCGKELIYKKNIYIILNKPSGILSAANDKSVKTVVDLIEGELKRPGLFPVGRLDKTTTGLLIITDDGDFAHRVISPKSNIPKTYIVGLDGDLTSEICEKFKNGIILADGTLCKPADCQMMGQRQAKVTITEGKYHQIKRMFGTVGLGVNTLHRESIGKLFLPSDLMMGNYSEISYNALKCLILDG